MMDSHNGKSANYREGSLSLPGAVAMGTGVMIGAGIFALTGQIAELAGNWFPLAFLLAAVVCGFSAYSYVKMANAYPSAGGIAMFLKKAYSRSTITGASALLMFFSMIINQSLVARTFATYSLEPFGGAPAWWWIPALGVALLLFAFTVNILGNKLIEGFSFFTAFLKIAGLVVLAGGGLWASGADFESLATRPPDTGVVSCLGAARADVGTVQVAEDRVENLVDVLNGFDKQQNNVVVIIVRGEIKLEITNVQSARGDRRLLTIDYVSTADSKTYRAAVDVTDVLLVEERPK